MLPLTPVPVLQQLVGGAALSTDCGPREAVRASDVGVEGAGLEIGGLLGGDRGLGLDGALGSGVLADGRVSVEAVGGGGGEVVRTVSAEELEGVGGEDGGGRDSLRVGGRGGGRGRGEARGAVEVERLWPWAEEGRVGAKVGWRGGSYASA